MGVFVHAGIVASVPAPLFGVVGQIQWAEQQIANLKTDLEAFINNRPYFMSREFDKDRGEIVFKYASHPMMPYDFSPRVGSVISTLASAMDYLAVQLVNTSGKLIPKSKIYFPVRDSRKVFFQLLKADDVIQAMRRGSKKRLRAAKPYKRGNYPIWLVNHLSKRVKHNDIIFLDTEFFLVKSNNPPTLLTFDEFNLHKTYGFFRPRAGQTYVDAFPIGHFSDTSGLQRLPIQVTGAEAYRFKVNGDFSRKQDFEFAFRISLADPKIVRGQSIIPTLDSLAQAVRKTLETFYSLFGGPPHVPPPKYTLFG